ncbi:MAG: capsule assembly Wzi family protein, partial [Bryobacteraceae bacterium]
RGTDGIAGGAVRASAGPFFAYARGEYQHAPGEGPYSDGQRQYIAQLDSVGELPPVRVAPVNRFELLDTYAGINIKNWEFSFGRQTLWWGSSEGGPFLFSDNAAPVDMLRINRVVPFRLPGVLGILGPMRVDFMVGRPRGQLTPAGQWIQGLRLGFKMTQNFEFGLTKTAQFGGVGRPGGFSAFWHALFPIHELQSELTGGPNYSNQEMSFDFLYRLRRYATFYSEFLGSDDPHPFDAPTRMAVNTGLYLPRLPRLPHLDLRVEGIYDDTPNNDFLKPSRAFLHYWHYIYTSGYTNDGYLLGNPIGRAAKGFSAQATYWFSSTHRLTVGLRRTVVDSHQGHPTGEADVTLPGGANWTDFSVQEERHLRSGLFVRSLFQIERLHYPILFPNRTMNVTASVEFGFAPEGGWR